MLLLERVNETSRDIYKVATYFGTTYNSLKSRKEIYGKHKSLELEMCNSYRYCTQNV